MAYPDVESIRRVPARRVPMSASQQLAAMISPEAILQAINGGGTSPVDYLSAAQAMLGGMGYDGGGGQSNLVGQAMQTINQAYRPEIAAIQRELLGSQNQEAQDIADINSWYGQLGGQYRANARSARKGGKRAAKATRKEARTAADNFGGPGAALLMRDAAGAAAGERSLAGAEAGLASTLAANTMNQADYAALVRSRLHAGEREDMRAQLNALRSKKASSKSQARLSMQQQESGQQFEQMMALAQFLASQGGGGGGLEQAGQAMQLLMQGGAAGLPGFEQYAPQQEVDPGEMLKLYSSMINPEDDLAENQQRMSDAMTAFGLEGGSQNTAAMDLALRMAGIDPDEVKDKSKSSLFGIPARDGSLYSMYQKKFGQDPKDRWYENLFGLLN